jgi:hypothetical protein
MGTKKGEGAIIWPFREAEREREREREGYFECVRLEKKKKQD